jgi:hypothetical protein
MQVPTRLQQLLETLPPSWRTRCFRSMRRRRAFTTLVVIHPIADGNGRHSRFMTDCLRKREGVAAFTWGRGSDPGELGDVRLRYTDALRAADGGGSTSHVLCDDLDARRGARPQYKPNGGLGIMSCRSSRSGARRLETICSRSAFIVERQLLVADSTGRCNTLIAAPRNLPVTQSRSHEPRQMQAAGQWQFPTDPLLAYEFTVSQPESGHRTCELVST